MQEAEELLGGVNHSTFTAMFAMMPGDNIVVLARMYHAFVKVSYSNSKEANTCVSCANGDKACAHTDFEGLVI